MLIIKSPWLHEDIWTHHNDDTVIVRRSLVMKEFKEVLWLGLNHLYQYHDYMMMTMIMMMMMMMMMMLRKRFKEVSVLRGRF